MKFVTSAFQKQHGDPQRDNKSKKENEERRLYNPYLLNSPYGYQFISTRPNITQYNVGPAPQKSLGRRLSVAGRSASNSDRLH